MVVILVIAIVVVRLAVMPALSDQVYAGSINSEINNKGQQGELKSEGKRQGMVEIIVQNAMIAVVALAWPKTHARISA